MQVGFVYHTGFTVSDIERSIAFYRDVLGLRLVRRQTGTAPYLASVTGLATRDTAPTAPQRSRSPSMMEASISTVPAAVSTEPRPALKRG